MSDKELGSSLQAQDLRLLAALAQRAHGASSVI